MKYLAVIGVLMAGALVSGLPRPGPGPVAGPRPQPSPVAAPLPQPAPGPSGYGPLAYVGHGCRGCLAGYNGYGYGGYDFKYHGEGYGYDSYLQFPFYGY